MEELGGCGGDAVGGAAGGAGVAGVGEGGGDFLEVDAVVEVGDHGAGGVEECAGVVGFEALVGGVAAVGAVGEGGG